MSENTCEAPQADDEISLLDLLSTLTENLRLLILGPLLTGMAALGIGFVIAPTFESRAVLRFDGAAKVTNEAAGTALASEDLLAAVLPAASWIDKNALPSEQLEHLRANVKATLNKKEGTLSLAVKGPSPKQAQNLHLAVIEELQKQLLHKGRAREEIEQSLASVRNTLEEIDSVMQALAKQVIKASPDSEASSRAYGLLLQQRMTAQQTLQDLEFSLKPFGDEVIAQKPTLPDKPVKPQKALLVAITTLATGFVLLLFVFMRQALRSATKNPEDASRLASIRSNLARSFFLSRDRSGTQ